MRKLLWYGLTGLFILGSAAGAAAKEVVPGSVQDNQIQKFVAALSATRTACSETLLSSENSFFCATTSRPPEAFRNAVDRQTETLKPVGPWAAYEGEDGQQRSYIYKDGFMTVSYFPSSRSEQNVWIVQYIMPHD